MPSDEEIVRLIQNFCERDVFEERLTESGKRYHEYQQSWNERLESEEGGTLSNTKRANVTLKKIQEQVKSIFNEVEVEKPISSRDIGSAFDIWNPVTKTAIEICLGAIKNEFEKDVLKAMLDYDVKELIIMIREFKTGSKDTIYGKRWFQHPYQKGVIALVKNFKLDVDVKPLYPSDD